MKPYRLTLIAVAVAALLLLVLVSEGDDEGPPENAVVVSFIYSPEKEDLIAPLIEDFNDSGAEADGAEVFVDAQVLSSGETEEKIAAGKLAPVAWSPASSLWGRLLNYEANRELVADDAPSLVRTPLVIAMWEPLARALGWPDAEVGFEEILDLARAPGGWAALGHPGFGDFKLVHTNPEFSTSGLAAVVAEYYAATGKRGGLTEADITGSSREEVREIEGSIVHYGDTTLFVADQMREHGPAYASAVAMEETTLLGFNQDRGDQPKLVAIYPKEGTFFSDNPFYILDAPWVTPAERSGAKQLQDYLSENIDPELAAESGFRPADVTEPPGEEISAENGADPSKPTELLPFPSPAVVSKIKRSWRKDRKPANVMLVVDVSGSMAEEGRIERVKEGLDTFINQAESLDYVGLLAFDHELQTLVPIGPLGEEEGALERNAADLLPDGGAAMRDAILEGYRQVRRSSVGSDRINAVVVLTDGEDTDSAVSQARLLDEISAEGGSPEQVRVFTIAFDVTDEETAEALREISEASGGQYYESGRRDVAPVYRSISSFF